MISTAQSFPLPSAPGRKRALSVPAPRWTLGAALSVGLLLWSVGRHFSSSTPQAVSVTRADADVAPIANHYAGPPPSLSGVPEQDSSKPVQSLPPTPGAALPGVAPSSDRTSALAKSYELEAKLDFKSAVETLRPLVNASAKDYFLRLRLAYLEACAKQYLEAAKDYAQAARLEPRSIEALLGQQQAALALGDYPGTEYLAKEIARRDANNYLANSRLAWALFSQKRYAKARDVYAKLVALYPADTEMLLGLGYAQSRMGATTQAEASFRAVLSIVPADKRARTGLDELAKK